ncbi:MAG TPA: bifunctional methylenetetrahydrofolate dehydrogenase/methenyltetrahydrofolate cyclohydrolase FolD [Burkholderiales bacterium]|nr:bifunctional methylenetetrahydrofolate dehydrogenase/methenyltetrahydrofolate cyclohydrolase FolD [Burkholderiales bacterium]
MSAQLLDGKSLAASIRASVRERIASARVRPGLAVILAGDDPASRIYVRNKTRACEEAGVHSVQIDYPSSVSQDEILARIGALNADPSIHALLVQLPLPRHLDAGRIQQAVSPAKDADGFHEANLGALLAGRPRFVPCTPAGILRMLDTAGIALAGRHAVVLGRSAIVGKPLAHLLLQRDATVTICHSRTRDVAAECRRADVLIAAVGRAKLVGAAMVKPGACVVDVGINRLADGSLAGDVDFHAVKEVAGWITPVPGGVGPMTIAMLLENCLHAATR